MNRTAKTPVRVAIVDDHVLVRDGIAALIDSAEGLTVCAQAGDTPEAIEVIAATRPDVVVMDVSLAGGTSGIQATREIRAAHPNTYVLMLTSSTDDDALFASIMAGASGYVLKQIRGNDLIGAIRIVASGQSLLDPSMTTAVLDRMRRGRDALQDEKLARLTAREEKVLELVAEGKTNREIGEALFLSEKTVKNHLSSVLSKLQVARRAEAAAYLTRHKRHRGRS